MTPNPLFELSAFAFVVLQRKVKKAQQLPHATAIMKEDLYHLADALCDFKLLLDRRNWIDRIVEHEIDKLVDACQVLIKAKAVAAGVLPSGGFSVRLTDNTPQDRGTK